MAFTLFSRTRTSTGPLTVKRTQTPHKRTKLPFAGRGRCW